MSTNTFIENTNYLANIDFSLGKTLILSKSNIVFTNTSVYSADASFNVYNTSTGKNEVITNTTTLLTIVNFSTWLSSIQAQIQLAYPVVMTSTYVAGSSSSLDVSITTSSANYYLRSFNINIKADGILKYSITSTVVSPMQVLPSLANSFTPELVTSAITVATNVVSINKIASIAADITTVANSSLDVAAVVAQVIPSMAEILLADNNAVIATIKASEASISAISALANKNATDADVIISTTQAGIAITQAATATTQAGIAITQAAAAAYSYDSFDDRYLGSKSVAPTLDNDWMALLIGALYWDSAISGMRAWNGTTWVTLPAAIAGAVANIPSGGIGATTVQAALNELDAEKAPLASPTFTGTVSGITKGMVGLGNVDNTTDLLKPISTATQTALNFKAPLASPTFTGEPTVAGAGILTNVAVLCGGYF